MNPPATDEVVIRVAIVSAIEIETRTAAEIANAETEIAVATATAAGAAHQTRRKPHAARQVATEAIGVEAGAGTVTTGTHAVIETAITTAAVDTPMAARALGLLVAATTVPVTEMTAGNTETGVRGERTIMNAAADELHVQIERTESLRLRSSPRMREIVEQYLYNSLLLG